MIKSIRKAGLVVLLLCQTWLMFSQDFAAISMEYLQRQAPSKGLLPEDLEGLKITDQHQSSVSGITHVYLQQFAGGVPVREGIASVHLTKEGEVFHVNNDLIGHLSEKTETREPALTTLQSVSLAGKYLKATIKNHLSFVDERGGVASFRYANEAGNQEFVIQSYLVYELNENGKLRLSRNVIFPMPDGHDTWEIRIDAVTGKELSRHNRTVHCQFENEIPENRSKDAAAPPNRNSSIITHPSGMAPESGAMPVSSFSGQYNIFAPPVESPLYGTRSLKSGTDLINVTASPYGWHDTDGILPSPDFEYTKGNNVYAYYAPLLSGSNPAASPITRISGVYASGNVPWPNNLLFDYNNSLNSPLGTSFIEDAVTNLFAWNNICHDVYYLYGFNEAAGNFQQTNITSQGSGNDFVLAQAQDGSGLNNASFSTPPDGQSPTMRMFLWNSSLPAAILDGDFDNAVITHEYGHGVSFRLVGGPGNVSCLTNFEQGGEGWSDFFGLMLTLADKNGNNVLEENVQGEGIRSIGAYVRGQGADGSGIRPAFYTSNMNCPAGGICNDFTYGDVNSMAIPHGVGFLWCTMLWDMTWQLINQYGFQPNIQNVSSTAGNIRAMKIVVEGLKLTPCNPSFPEMRDAILAANNAIYGGQGNDLIWEAFARRGLGYSATAGGNEAFDNPTMRVTKTVNKEQAVIGDAVTYTITVKNNYSAPLTNVIISDPLPANLSVTSISDGGAISGNKLIYPAIPSIPVSGTETRTFSGIITAASGTTVEYDNPIESAIQPDFVPAGVWLVDGGSPNPVTGSTLSWWHLDPPIYSDASLILTVNLNSSKNNHLSFWQSFDLESTIDGGVIEILNGTEWVDLGSKIKKNGYNSILFDALPTPIGIPVPLTPLSGRRAFTGYSGGYVQTIVDLSAYSGTKQIRFRFASNAGGNNTANCDGSTPGCDGWFLDDFKVFDLKNILNTAGAESAQGFTENGDVGQIGTIYFAGAPLPVELIWFDAKAREQDILLTWTTASELNNGGFELQRRSEAETDFKEIARIKGQGNSSGKVDYQFLDTDVQPNVQYYYRLKQVDFDGREKLSDIVFATIFSKEETVSLFPNPASDKVFIKFGKQLSEPVFVEIMNAGGQRTAAYNFGSGSQLYALDCSMLPAGIYYCKIQTGDSFFSKKLIVP